MQELLLAVDVFVVGVLLGLYVCSELFATPAMEHWKSALDGWKKTLEECAALISKNIELRLQIRRYERDQGIISPIQIDAHEQ